MEELFGVGGGGKGSYLTTVRGEKEMKSNLMGGGWGLCWSAT